MIYYYRQELERTEKMKLKYTTFELIMEMIALVFLVGTFAYLFMMLEALPNEIVTHFDAQGMADEWGNKTEIFQVPFMGLAIYTFASILQRFPKRWNVGIEADHKNAEQVYRYTKDMIIVLKMEIAVFFAYYGYAAANQKPMVSFFLPAVLIVTFGTIVFYMVKVSLAKKEGDSIQARMERRKKWFS